MKRKLLIRLFSALLAIPVLLAASISWLVMTENGTRWLVNQSLSFAPGNASIQTIQGRLIGPLSLSGINYQDNELIISAQQLKLDWLPSKLFHKTADITQLHIEGLDITLPAAAPQAEIAASSPLELPDIILPIDLLLNDILIKNINVSQANKTLQTLNKVALEGGMQQDQIELKLFSVNAPDYQAEIAGKLQTSQDYPHALTINWQFRIPDYPSMSGNGLIQGDTEKLTVEHLLQTPFKADLNAEAQNLLDKLEWQAKLTIKDFETQIIDPSLPQFETDASVVANGTIETLQGHVKLNGKMAEIGGFDAEVKIRRLENQDISIDALSLNIPNTKTTINGQGEWLANDAANQFNAELSWQNISWPLQGVPIVTSDSGNLVANGKLDAYNIKADMKVRGEQIPTGNWRLSVSGSDKAATLTSLRGETLKGVINGSGQFSWQPELTWRTQLNGQNINPAEQWTNWPGQIAFTINSEGSRIDENLTAKINIEDISGTLRDYPIVAQAQARLQNEHLEIDQLILQSAESHLSAAGHIGQTIDLNALLEVPSLAQLYPDAAGTLSVVAEVRGTQTDPLVKLNINGKDLILQDYKISSVIGELSGDVMHWNATQLQLDASNIDLAGFEITTLSTSAFGTNGKHEAQIAADTSEGKLALKLDGRFDAAAQTDSSINPTWRGTLRQSDIITKEFGQWRLNQVGNLIIADNEKQIGPLCWTADNSTLCLDAQQLAQAWTGDLSLRELELALFAPLLPPDMVINGQVNLNAKARYKDKEPINANVDITLPGGNIEYQIGEDIRQSWPYKQGKLSAVVDNNGMQSNLNIDFINGDKLRGTVNLPGADLMAMEPELQVVAANAIISIGDLSILEVLVPSIENVQGKIELNTALSGTLGQPQLKLNGDLSKGAITIPDLNITINEIHSTLTSDNNQLLRLEANARSGGGTINILGKTELNADKKWPTEFNIKGKAFEVARIPEARVEISPDLAVSIQGNEIRVNGEINVPLANLQPKDVSSAVTVSDDVVIIGDTEITKEQMQIFARVKVILGNRVRFFGFGFDGQLGGDITIIEKPGKPTTANGELKIVEGRYRAYGQRLDINDGRAFYSGGPVNNPGLEMRAIRTVQDIIVGLKIGGSVNSPRIELFSEPAMDQAETLSYLILGRSMEGSSQEEGQAMAGAALALGLAGGDTLARRIGQRFGFDELRVDTSETGGSSLLLGRYLSPRLYLSYGVGLVDATNTINVRYDLTKQLQVIGESGDTHGADLLYTIKR